MKPKKRKTPATKKLGNLIRIYRDRRLSWRDLFLTFFPASVAVMTPLVYGQWRVQYAHKYYGSAAAQSWGRPWFALSTVALIPLLWLALLRVRRAHRIVAVFQKGILIRGTGGIKKILTWDEISGIAEVTQLDRFLGITLRKKHRATIYPTIGKQIKLDHKLPDFAELCARIKGKIYPRVLPQLRTSLAAGNQLYFGPVQIHLQGIDINAVKIPWSEISRINVHKGVVMVKSKNHRTLRIPVGDIPNIELLIQLIQEGIEV